MANSNAKTSFSITNPEATASYGMVRKIASQFSKSAKCPKDINGEQFMVISYRN